MDENDAYQQAQEKVAQLKGFYKHLFFYLLINSLLLILNLTTNPNHLWFYWPLLGWGIGLSSHALKVYDISIPLFKNWEEKKTQELAEKYQNKDNN